MGRMTKLDTEVSSTLSNNVQLKFLFSRRLLHKGWDCLSRNSFNNSLRICCFDRIDFVVNNREWNKNKKFENNGKHFSPRIYNVSLAGC